MIQVSLDTSFLISFADPDRPNHGVAVDYFRHCLAQRIPMWISVVAAGEFEGGEPVTDLPLQNFRVQPYNLTHAIRAAGFFRTLHQGDSAKAVDRRPIIINDLKIIAQAEEGQIPVILTEDANTLSRLASRLRENRASLVHVLLLTENPDQGELPLPSASR